jgi:hypothetical protein
MATAWETLGSYIEAAVVIVPGHLRNALHCVEIGREPGSYGGVL